MTSPARARWILALVLIAGIALAWWMRQRPPQYSVAYVGERSASVWSTTAQVRQTVGTLGYGDKVSLIRESGDRSEIRTASGVQGWVDSRLLMTPEMWHRLAEILSAARAMPVQAVGHTRALSNVHVEPNRDAQRIFQFGANVPVLILDRKSESILGQSGAGASVPAASAAQPKQQDSAPKLEDWLLVLRMEGKAGAQPTTPSAPVSSAISLPPDVQPVPGAADAPAGPSADLPIAGWILARFVELDPPPPIPDYASAAGLRVVAWVTLNMVSDEEGPKPQFLVAGTRGAEAPGCEFTSFRVFTWDGRRQHYETAYVGNNVCGHLPILVQQAPSGANFHFPDPGGENQQRHYEFRQTIVRPVNPPGVAAKGDSRKLRQAPRRKRL